MQSIMSSPHLLLAFAFAGLGALLALRSYGELRADVSARHRIAHRLQSGILDRAGALFAIDVRRQRALEEIGLFKRLSEYFNRLITHSGLKFRPVIWTALTTLLAVGIGGAAHWQFKLIWVTVPIVVVASLLVPIGVLKMYAARRRKRINRQLTDALQVIVRSLEAGHPVSASLQLVSREMPAPLGTEFLLAADEVAYGISLTQGINRMSERIGDADVDLFAATIRLQERTGGNLCELLKNNMSTIRERQTLRLKVKAASAEGRMSSTILTAAPFVVAGGIHVMEPNFYGYVLDDPNFRYAMIGFVIWMGIGNLIMKKMIAFDV